MKDKYKSLFSKLEPYCVCSPATFNKIKYSQLLKKIPDDKFFNPLLTSSQSFIEKVFKMDEMTFGEKNMAMERWVFFDCAVMPGFAFGYAIQGRDISEADRKTLNISKNESFPISLYIAIPMEKQGKWFGHNLSSLNGKLEEDLSGLGFLTKAVALDLFGVEILVGATQWDSLALLIHKKFGVMKLLSALTPIHSQQNTLCYQTEICSLEFNLMSQLTSSPMGTLFSPNLEKLKKLQMEIEAGQEVFINNIYLDEEGLKFFI